ncbi:MAG: hypothetical protein CML65_22000 [Rhodobacteraceae bacterium]|nr:hypothetical protein [Paracoccaceae bacterium]
MSAPPPRPTCWCPSPRGRCAWPEARRLPEIWISCPEGPCRVAAAGASDLDFCTAALQRSTPLVEFISHAPQGVPPGTSTTKATIQMSDAQPRTIRIGADDGISLRIWDGETDQVLLLIHGMADCSWIWAPLVENWPGPRPTFIAVDLPGHGDSAPVSRREMKSDAVAERLADALKSDALTGFARTPMWVAGHSAGAKVAIGLLKRAAVPALGLTLVDTADDHLPNMRDRLFAHVASMRKGAANVKGLVSRITGADPFANPALLDSYFRAAARHDGAVWHVPVARGIEAILATDIDMTGDLATLDVPVQVIRGAGSSICTDAMAGKFLAACAQPLPLVAIPRAGHGITMAQPAPLAMALATALPAAAEPLRHSG